MTGVVDTIRSVAARLGVDPDLAVAIASRESGLDPQAVGDNGTSFGLFQLHRGGELGSLTPQQAFDPATNAGVALAEVARVQSAHPGWTPGHIAAAAQRPKDQAAYAVAVDQEVTRIKGGGSIISKITGAPGAIAGGITGTVENWITSYTSDVLKPLVYEGTFGIFALALIGVGLVVAFVKPSTDKAADQLRGSAGSLAGAVK